MHILKVFVSMVLGMAALVVALKLLGLFFFLVAIIAKLLWMIIVVGFIALVGYVIYKLVTPGRAEQL
ncbi:MAG TPA: hypothetical protein VI756_08230 [Blastocatellia bacterium]